MNNKINFPTEWNSELGCFVLSESTDFFREGIPVLSAYDAVLRSLRESMEMLTDSGMIADAQRVRGIWQSVGHQKMEFEISERERASLA